MKYGERLIVKYLWRKLLLVREVGFFAERKPVKGNSFLLKGLFIFMATQ